MSTVSPLCLQVLYLQIQPIAESKILKKKRSGMLILKQYGITTIYMALTLYSLLQVI